MEPRKKNHSETDAAPPRRESKRAQSLIEMFEYRSTEVTVSPGGAEGPKVHRKSKSTSEVCIPAEEPQAKFESATGYRPSQFVLTDTRSCNSYQLTKENDAWLHFHAQVQELSMSLMEKKPERSSWWDMLNYYTGWGARPTPNSIYEEIEYSNQVMSDVMSLWRNRPSEEEIKTHHETMACMKDKQKKALSYLENIINHDLKGTFLLTKNSPKTSNLDLFSVLMCDSWCHPKDLKTFEVPVTQEILKVDKMDPEGKGKINEYSNKIQMYLTHLLRIDPSYVFVQPPKTHVVGYALQAQGGFRVLMNAAKMALADTINLAPASKPPLIVQLSRIDEVKRDQIPVFKLDASDFDTRGDFQFPCVNGDNQTRGKMPYKQPTRKWVRVGLKVTGRYDNGNDDWLMMNGNPNEWAIGFHGSFSDGGNQGIASSREIRPGGGQAHRADKDVNRLSDNYNGLCGIGSYFADDIEIARSYAKSVEGRKCVFQARLKPSKVRIPTRNTSYRIVNETKYARPYGICIKYES